MDSLNADIIESRLSQHPDWRTESGHLARDIQFPNFVSAWRFMNYVADVAEQQNHHPNWYNVYGTVQIRLSTHDADGLTNRDFELARSIDHYLSTEEYTNLPPTPFNG